ncbi:hypothetical protein ACIBCT_35780 [Streptosporangium sp. NPDC050855]|uniref:hypothetical protein n=1 Tax=Streptosporangium sp. NPDC050855 TaxID=3366194 RepID=UPI00379E5225
MHTTKLPELHPAAAALTAFREVNGEGRTYTVSEAPGGRGSIVRSLNRARAVGYVKPPERDCYAVLDVLNGDDEPVQEFAIPTARAFRWWYRHLRLRVERDDA